MAYRILGGTLAVHLHKKIIMTIAWAITVVQVIPPPLNLLFNWPFIPTSSLDHYLSGFLNKSEESSNVMYLLTLQTVISAAPPQRVEHLLVKNGLPIRYI